ncbi:MAG: putative transporter [Proteobacteria bacterium]|jgi:putative transport protein|nr:putative transporter [Pseudomonadota bacterium]
MDWLSQLFLGDSVAHSVLILALVVTTGLLLGGVRVFGVSLGVGGVLFAGLAFGHFDLTLNHELMEFVKEFGLILFVYAIGLQVGPGFFASLRRQGLSLTIAAATIVLGGTAIAVAIGLLAGIDFTAAVGLLTGAVTNTPSLGAAQQALKDLPAAGADAASVVGMGYAVAYPFGIVGIILTMIIVRRLFRIDPAAEAAEFERLQHEGVQPILTKNFEVLNANLAGLSIEQLAELTGPGAIVTRICRRGVQQLALAEVRLEVGDVVHAIGTTSRLDAFRVIVGRESDVDLPKLPSRIAVRRVVVTRKAPCGKELHALGLDERYGVIITRIIRAGLEFTPTRDLRVQFGDRLVIVGVEQAVERAAKELGDSVGELDKTHIVPFFVGIALGVLLGSLPIAIPHMPAPIKLGLAGGPLIVAIALSRLGKAGPFIAYMPNPAKMMLRELGISLFLACVGLAAGEKFFGILASGDGFLWMGLAAIITFVPIFAVALYMRGRRKLNFVSLCGLLSGSMTDPPALAYATQLVKSDAVSIAYATVYPLTMLLRVVIAQIVVVLALG